jgi:hypothetical protein
MDFLANPYVAGALTGLLTAAHVDFAAFQKWKSFDEAAAYGWKLAFWRWFQGALVGLVAAGGIDGLT